MSKSQKIREMLSAGKSSDEIASELECSKQLIYQVRRKADKANGAPRKKVRSRKKAARKAPVAQFGGETSGFLVQYEALISADDLLKKCGGSREQAMQAIATIIMLEESRKGSE